MNWFWAGASFAGAVYCLARAITDLRGKRYVWGALGLISAVIILANPIGQETQAVKVDFPG